MLPTAPKNLCKLSNDEQDLPNTAFMNTPIRISMIEDDQDVSTHVRGVIEADPEFEFLDLAHTAGEGLEKIARRPPDLLLLDLGLPDMHGSQCIPGLKRDHPELKIVVFTVFEDEDNIIRAIQSGANGYLLKDTASFLLLLELRVIMMGGATLTPRVAHRIAGMLRERTAPAGDDEIAPDPLTARESEVLHLVALGYTYNDIADEMGIKGRTVRGYIETIYRKLDVHSKSEAIIKGRRQGLLRSLFD